MALLSREKYRALTQDHTTEGAKLQLAIDEAQSLLEDFLHRKLESAAVVDETTIAYRAKGGRFFAYPERMPVTAVSTPGWEFTNTGILKSATSGWSIVYNLDYVSELSPTEFEVVVSYTGGFTPTTAPSRLLQAIAKLAQHLITLPSQSQIMAGVSSMSVGPVSISVDTTSIIPDEIEKLAKGFQRRKY